MKRLSDILSPTTSLLSWLALCVSLVALFRPTLREFLLCAAVDTLALILTISIDRVLFPRLFPAYRPVFNQVDEGKLATLSPLEKAELFQELLAFPFRRSLYFLLVSFFKVAPASLMVTFFWHHPDSVSDRAVRMILVEIMIQGYFFGSVYVESHMRVSQLLESLHDRYDWSDVFQTSQVPSRQKEYSRHLYVAFGTLLSFAGMLLMFLVTTEWQRPLLERIVIIGGVTLTSCLLFFRLWTLDRNLFHGGLEKVFDSFSSLDFRTSGTRTIPLHSTHALARFQRTFNELTTRLREQETHISQWIAHETEQSRARVLGELSSVVIHDMAGPLQVAQFCADELKANPDAPNRSALLEQLHLGIGRISGLTLSLRTALRTSKASSDGIGFGKAHEDVLRFLDTEFADRGFRKIQITVDSRLPDVTTVMPQSDLVHILYSIYKNRTESLLASDTRSPSIQTTLIACDPASILIDVSDNGPALSTEGFESMTTGGVLAGTQEIFHEWLGLRLVRRLLERHNGNLTVLPSTQGNSVLRITLPRTVQHQRPLRPRTVTRARVSESATASL